MIFHIKRGMYVRRKPRERLNYECLIPKVKHISDVEEVLKEEAGDLFQV